jgi:hypothetical protein
MSCLIHSPSTTSVRDPTEQFNTQLLKNLFEQTSNRPARISETTTSTQFAQQSASTEEHPACIAAGDHRRTIPRFGANLKTFRFPVSAQAAQ